MDKEIKLATCRVKLLTALDEIIDDSDEKHTLIVQLTNFLLELNNPANKFTLFCRGAQGAYTVINTCKNIDVRLCGLIKKLKTHAPEERDTKSIWISGIQGLPNFTAEEYTAEVEKCKDDAIKSVWRTDYSFEDSSSDYSSDDTDNYDDLPDDSIVND